jgi:hypothetical protein
MFVCEHDIRQDRGEFDPHDYLSEQRAPDFPESFAEPRFNVQTPLRVA